MLHRLCTNLRNKLYLLPTKIWLVLLNLAYVCICSLLERFRFRLYWFHSLPKLIISENDTFICFYILKFFFHYSFCLQYYIHNQLQLINGHRYSHQIHELYVFFFQLKIETLKQYCFQIFDIFFHQYQFHKIVIWIVLNVSKPIWNDCPVLGRICFKAFTIFRFSANTDDVYKFCCINQIQRVRNICLPVQHWRLKYKTIFSLWTSFCEK